MRRPALHHTTGTALRAAGGWSHPYAPSPFIFYADGGNDDPAAPAPAPTGGTPADPPKPTAPSGKVFTQAEVEALAAREKDQGKRAGARAALEDFAKEHGFTTVDDAKAFIEQARQAKQAQMTEVERREQAAAELERQASEKIAQAEARERAAARRSVLVGLGATGDDLEDAAALLRVEDDADETAVAEAATKLKARRPELFGTPRPADGTQAPAPTAPPAPGGAPAGGPPPRQPATKTDTKARAHALAVKMGYAKPDTAA